jgi:tRNA A37 threonylcarbamoyladenosine biosynthesis protein TsaE
MDYLARAEKGVAIIEWADKVLPLLPDDRLVVRFDVLSTRKRRLELTAHGRRLGRIVRGLESK